MTNYQLKQNHGTTYHTAANLSAAKSACLKALKDGARLATILVGTNGELARTPEMTTWDETYC